MSKTFSCVELWHTVATMLTFLLQHTNQSRSNHKKVICFAQYVELRRGPIGIVIWKKKSEKVPATPNSSSEDMDKVENVTKISHPSIPSLQVRDWPECRKTIQIN